MTKLIARIVLVALVSSTTLAALALPASATDGRGFISRTH